MAIFTAGFILAQLGLRVLPVFLRSATKKAGQLALRYIVTDPNAKVKITSEFAKKVLKGKYVDDIGKLTIKSKDNPVLKVLNSKDLKLLSAGERNTLMQESYRDASKLMQRKTSYGHETKIASDIQKGFGQSFSKEFAGRQFIAGDRVAVAFKTSIEKAVAAPKALPKPTAGGIGPYYKPPVSPLEVAKSGVGIPQVTPGLTALQRGAFRTLKRAKTGEKTTPIKQLVKRAKEEKTSLAGKSDLAVAKQLLRERRLEKVPLGPTITEGLRGVGSAPKPAWWQAMVPKVLRVGGYEGPGYAGAYPAAVSGPRVGIATGGLLFGGATIPPIAEHLVKRHLAKKDILTVEQIMEAAGDTYGEAYDPNAIISKLESGDVILPEKIE